MEAALDRLRAFARRDVAHFRGHSLHLSEGRLVAAFDGPARAIRCAVALALTARRLGVRFRSGLDIGQCETRPEAIVCPVVDCAAALADTATPGVVLVSQAVRDLVAGAGLAFEPMRQDTSLPACVSAAYRVDARSVSTPGHDVHT